MILRPLFGRTARLVVMTFLIAVCIVMGLTGRIISHTPPFVLLLTLFLVQTAAGAVDDWRHRHQRPLGATLCHTGFALFLVASLLSGATRRSGIARLEPHQAVGMAIDENGFALPLPFVLELDSFQLDSYTSHVKAMGPITVNHPYRHGAWRVYQTGCDDEHGSYSILTCIRDPFAPLQAVALWLMLLGGAVMAVRGMAGQSHGWRVSLIALALAAVYAAIVFSMMHLMDAPLVPALRSPWFIPHVAAYMIAYSLLTVATVSAAVSALTSDDTLRERFAALFRRTLRSGWGMLTMGLVMGALWAWAAWGSCWSWDAKETWAAATWLSYLLLLHLPARRKPSTLFLLALIAFLLLQMSWYGLNWLPSSAASVHAYQMG